MNDILEKICQNKKIEIEKNKSRCSYSSLEKLINNQKNRNFKELLYNSHKMKKNNIIAEIKKGSPSAGIIINDYSPENIAVEYEKAGIGAISILTDEKFFFGEIDHLSVVSKITNLPIIRKDFIIDEYQIIESKVYEADAILLILSILNDNQIKKFIKLAKEFNLDCLVEAHTKEELQRAINIGYPVIGINNRNLKNLSINLDNTLDMIKNIPNEFIIVAESGIKTKKDIDRFNNLGIHNFLIGESILKANNHSDKIKELIN